MKNITAAHGIRKIEPILKGWSADRKYKLETEDGRQLLLRVSDSAEEEQKRLEFRMLGRMKELEVPTQRPIDFGSCEDGRSCYQLLTWIPGEDAQDVLPRLTAEEQYALGVKSGEILRRIHSIPAPESQEPWGDRFNRKASTKIARYRDCGLRFPGDEAVIGYIEQNRSLLENRPQCFQHGDYHAGNMIIDAQRQLWIIDWNRPDCGDPWEEFNRIVWSADASIAFANGQLHAYFGGDPPLEFFRLLAFYMASNTLSSVYWAIPFGEEEVSIMMRQTQEVLGWFDGMRNPVPGWYRRAGAVWL